MTQTVLRVGLTGPIGAGKSVVAATWEELGAGVVEGDAMGRLALETDPALRNRLAEHFGREILADSREIIKSRLAAAAFANPEKARKLTELTFPVLYDLARQHLSTMSANHEIVVFDAALIYEWRVDSDFDVIVAVKSHRDVLITRVMHRLKISRDDAVSRLAAQIDPDEKAKRADIVIENDYGEIQLKARARDVWQELLRIHRGKVKNLPHR